MIFNMCSENDNERRIKSVFEGGAGTNFRIINSGRLFFSNEDRECPKGDGN